MSWFPGFGSSSSSSSSSSSAAAPPRSETGVVGAGPEAGSKAVVLKVFGPQLGEVLALAAGHGKTKDYRGVLEPTGAVTQCERSGHPFKPGMPCYICGLPIPAKEELFGPDDELYVECEHVLPVTEARWFLDLYMTTRPPTDDWTKKALYLEYDQSHRVCNQAKSNFSFLKAGEPGVGVPEVSSVGIKKILKNIQARARDNIAKYSTRPALADLMSQIATTVLNREAAIRSRVQPILDHIREEPAVANPENQGMILLLRTGLLADPGALPTSIRTLHDQWYANAPIAKEETTRLFRLFLEDTYKAYPDLNPDGQLLTTIDTKVFPSGLLTRDLVGEILQTFFLKTGSQMTTPDPYGSFVRSAVYYGLYTRALDTILQRRYTTTEYPTICALYAHADGFREKEPRVLTVFPDLPTLPDPVKSSCEIAKRNEDRAARARERAARANEDAQSVAKTAGRNLLIDFVKYITSEFMSIGMTPADANKQAKALYPAALDEFVRTYPEGIERAREAAANTVSVAIVLSSMATPAATEKLADNAFAFLVGAPVESRQPSGPMKSGPSSSMMKSFQRTMGGRRTYRKSKPSTSSPRTRRARHSGRSKRQTTRSSRKSQRGK